MSSNPYKLPYFVFIPLLLLPGCSPTERLAGKNYGPVFVSDRVSFSLLAPEYIEKNIDMFQRISGSYGKNHFAVNAWVRADERGITMELLNDLGGSLGELSFTGEELSFTSSFFPRNLKAEYVAADFQFCFYQVPALRRALEGISIETEGEQNTERRFFYEGNKLLIEIEKKPGSVEYTNHLRGYSYSILGDFS